jgi:hypothetical protein
MSTEAGIYVFCAIQETKPQLFGKVKLNGHESDVFTIHYKNAAMVASKVKGDVLPERMNLFAHQEIITKIMKQYSVIPMSFGNVFNSEEDIIHISKHLYSEFEKLFIQIENKFEVGLKVIPKKEWMDQELQKDPLLNKWKEKQKDVSNPAEFYQRIELGEMAQSFVISLQEQVEKDVYEPLLALAEAGKQNAIIPGKTLLNAAFLIDKEKEAAFDEKVNHLYDRWKDRVDFKYTGPWPVYNFVNIRLRIEG